MQPGRLKWPLGSVFIGKISATSQQNIIVEILGKVKYEFLRLRIYSLALCLVCDWSIKTSGTARSNIPSLSDH